MFNTIEPNQIHYNHKETEYLLIDLRSRKEFNNDGLAGSIHIPYYELPDRLNELPTNKSLLFICNDGNMAGAARNFVKGYARLTNIFALAEGVGAVHKLLERQKAS